MLKFILKSLLKSISNKFCIKDYNLRRMNNNIQIVHSRFNSKGLGKLLNIFEKFKKFMKVIFRINSYKNKLIVNIFLLLELLKCTKHVFNPKIHKK